MTDKKKIASKMKNKSIPGKRWGEDKDPRPHKPLSKKEKEEKRGEDYFELNRGN